MKKWLPLLLCLALLLGGCSDRQSAKVTVDGKKFTVDSFSRTVTDGIISCTYEISSVDYATSAITVKYPNSATYRCTRTIDITGKETISGGSTTGDYDPNRYIPGETLARAVWKAQDKISGSSGIEWKYLIFGIICIVLGALSASAPTEIYLMFHRWKYKNVELSEAGKTAYGVSGIFVLIIGVICVIKALV